MGAQAPRSVSRTVRMEMMDVPLSGRWFSAELEVDVEHVPGETYRSCRSYYDSPPDPAETTVHAVRVVEWCEFDTDGNELPKVLTADDISNACMTQIEERAEELFV